MKVLTMHTYSPKEPSAVIRSVLETLQAGQTETWNLIYLLLPVERKYVFTAKATNKEVPVAAWRTVHSDAITGAFLNPHNHPNSERTVARLLRGPAEHFVDWASNTPVASMLPIHKVDPDWVATARSRLPKCVGYKPERTIADLGLAASALAKFKL